MIGRLRDGLLELLHGISQRCRALFRPPRQHFVPPVLKGTMRNVLVIKPSDDIFKEAIFILRDDYYQSPGLSRQELLRQAKDAAEAYLVAYSPSGGSRPHFPFAAIILPVCALLAILLIKLL